jgi:hypothetical protein
MLGMSAGMADRPHPRRWLTAVLLVLLAGAGAVSFDRAVRGRYDFHHFYLDARYVWQHRALNPNMAQPSTTPDQRQLPFYLPTVPLALAPITAWGRTPAAFIWAAAQIAALGISLRVLRRWSGADRGPPDGAWAFLIVLALAVPALYEAGRFNQLSYFVLVLVIGGIDMLQGNRPRTAGALFGLAAVLKLLPGIFLLWLLLKRQWQAACAFVVAVLLATALPPLIAFGPRQALAYHQEWWSYNVRGDAVAGLLDTALADHFIDHRNQSITQVLARLMWPEHPHAVPWQPLTLAPRTCTLLAAGVGAALLAALVWQTRRPGRVLGAGRLRVEGAAYALGMLVFSPLLRQYYLVWALPALVLLGRVSADPGAGSRRKYGPLGLWIWTAGMLAWVSPGARLLGVHLVMLLLVGAMLLATRTDGGARSPAEDAEAWGNGER